VARKYPRYQSGFFGMGLVAGDWRIPGQDPARGRNRAQAEFS